MIGMTREFFRPDQYLLALGALQHGCATRTQLDQLGVSRHTINRRLASELWVNVAPAVIRFAATQPTYEMRSAAAYLEAHKQAVFGGYTALRMHGLHFITPPSSVPTLLVPHERTHESPIAEVCQVRNFPHTETVELPWSGPVPEHINDAVVRFQATTIARSLIDIGSMSYPSHGLAPFKELATELVRRGHVHQHELIDAARNAYQLRRRHSRHLLAWLESLTLDALPVVGLEKEAHEWFAKWGVDHLLEYEVPHPAFPGTNKRADCVHRPRRRIFELDSRKHHLREAAFDEDRKRDLAALLAGWSTTRFTWSSFKPANRNETRMAVRRLCGLDGGVEGGKERGIDGEVNGAA
jgi:hypothetical protein